MSHGRPPPPGSMFGFGAVDVGPGSGSGHGHGHGHGHGYGPRRRPGVGMAGMGGLDGVSVSMAQDGQAMMPLLDNSVFAGFDTSVPMALDSIDDMAAAGFNPLFQRGLPGAPPAPPAALATAEAQLPPSTLAPNPLPGDAMALPGAGPLPVAPVASQGPQPATSAGGTLTEFTKRRNWSAKVVEELKDLLQILDSHGRIKHVSQSVTSLTGYAADELTDRLMRDLIHPDDTGLFTAELNEAIATGHPLRLFYRLRKKDGAYAIFEAVGHAHIAAARFAPNPNNQSPFCQAVFMMSRPYPAKNASLLDSFLEHKMENERLRRRIAELRKEEDDDAEEATRAWRQSQEEGRSETAPSDATSATNATNSGAPPLFHQFSDPSSMPPPDHRLNGALTRENLEGVAGAARSDSIREKMARYEGTHADTIEMLTGLRYQEGERSRGITTGNASPTLIRGDAGIAIPVDRDPRTGEKKKKLKVAEEYVCTDCGTLDSPEWRKGPSGPKTLCNACGLRWAKKEKKRNHQRSGLGGGGASALPHLIDQSEAR